MQYDKSYKSYLGEMVCLAHPEGKYAWTVTVGEKGQIVIPKKARELFDIKPGDTLMVLADVQQGIAIPPKAIFHSMMTTVFKTGGLEKGEDE